MKRAQIITVVACFLVVAAPSPARAEDSAESMTAQLRARAEAQPDPAVDRPDLSDFPVPDRLFFMRSYDHVRCVRSTDDVNGDGDHDVLLAVGDSGYRVVCMSGGSTQPASFLPAHIRERIERRIDGTSGTNSASAPDESQ